MKVPQFMPWVGQEEYEALESCFKSNWITEGPKSEEFRLKILDLTGAKYGVLAPNGTLALYLALRSAGIGPGDEVLVPDFTFMASASAVEMVGGRPVFVDVNRRNFQIDLSGADRLVTTKTKAVLPVHIYGSVADMDRVIEFARRHALLVVEDAAQAIGVRWKGRHAGTFGKTGIFSFFADKTITTAEGGMVVTDDPLVYDRLLFMRNQGRKDRGSFIHPEMGYNFRLTDLQAAVGLVQITKLDRIIARRRELLQAYREGLAGLPEVTFFEPDPGADWIPFRFCMLSPRAPQLMEHLKSREIETRTYFYPLHRQPAFSYLEGLDDRDFPNAIFGYEQGVCLPMFPTLSDEQLSHVCGSVREFFARPDV